MGFQTGAANDEMQVAWIYKAIATGVLLVGWAINQYVQYVESTHGLKPRGCKMICVNGHMV
jgi:hypothetical protein